MALAEMGDGNLWVGFEHGLVIIQNGSIWKHWFEDERFIVINAFMMGADKSVWVGTDRGLYRYRRETWEPVKRNNIRISGVKALLQAKDRSLWVGTENGLLNQRMGEWNEVRRFKYINITALVQMEDKTYWVGSKFDELDRSPGGLYYSEDEEWRYFEEITPENIEEKCITVLLKEDEDILWVGTTTGLARIHNKSKEMQLFTSANSDLNDNSITALSLGSDGSLWIGTEKGVARFRPPDPEKERPIVELSIPFKKQVLTQREQTFTASAFDPKYQTEPHMFKFHWEVISEAGKVIHMLDSNESSMAYIFEDGHSYTVKVTCSDCYGYRSKPDEFNFKIYLPSPTLDLEPGVNILKAILQYVLLALLAYLVFFPSLIVLYPRVKAARTLVKTGWFNKFPLLHYIIINSSWAWWLLFCKFVKEQPLPGHYVSQTIFPGYAPNPNPNAEISFKEGKFDESFAGLFINQRHAMILGRNGSGKTVLIRYLYNKVAATYKKRKTEFPIIIDICSSDIDNFSIEEIIYDTLCGQGVELPQKLFKFLLIKGGFIIFIDSLDTKEKETVRNKINPFLTRNLHCRNKILMASQFDLLKRDDVNLVNLFTVNEFSDEQARGLLSDTVDEDYWEELTAELKALTRKPQDLEFVGKALKNIPPQKVSKHQTEFYKGLLQRDNVLKPWIEDGSNKLDIIYKLSYRMLKGARNPLPEDRTYRGRPR